jgi:hypothetical protein
VMNQPMWIQATMRQFIVRLLPLGMP